MKSKITSIKDAMKFMGYKFELPDLKGIPEHLAKPLLADLIISVINEALVKEYFASKKETKIFPDWSKSSEWKYYPWWRIQADMDNPSGSGLSYFGYARTGTLTLVGSRFCLPTEELVRYSADKFKDHHQMRMIGK